MSRWLATQRAYFVAQSLSNLKVAKKTTYFFCFNIMATTKLDRRKYQSNARNLSYSCSIYLSTISIWIYYLVRVALVFSILFGFIAPSWECIFSHQFICLFLEQFHYWNGNCEKNASKMRENCGTLTLMPNFKWISKLEVGRSSWT